MKDIETIFEENFSEKVLKAGMVLLETDSDRDRLWELYLGSFPAAENPIYRKARLYDCAECRHFLKKIGGLVYIDDALAVHSLFEIESENPSFQSVFDALDRYVKSKKITGYFLYESDHLGVQSSRELFEGNLITYKHFSVNLPHDSLCGKYEIGTKHGRMIDERNVFFRSMNEISMDAVDTVLELISSNTLYKGMEWKSAILQFRYYKETFDMLPAEGKELYAWHAKPDAVIAKIRNHSIGTLLTNISDGEDLDTAVRKYEAIVAPTNYKRPKAIFTKRMLDEAQKKVEELGLMESLPRRFATLDDIRINNILFSNKDSAKRIAGNIFDEMKSDIPEGAKKFSRIESISSEKFFRDVLPGAREVELLLENRHEPNMVSLTAPKNPDSPTMFKWGNAFGWAYAGDMTDSDIQRNVKNAGGKVDGELRFSIQWNDLDAYDGNDVDAHCKCPSGEIYFGRRFVSSGNLDVDIISPIRGKAAVENIVFEKGKSLRDGDYECFVHCFACHGGKSGFRAEIEFGGMIYRYDYRTPLRTGEIVKVATVHIKHGSMTIDHKLRSEESSREVWGLKTNTFVPVSVIMNSPNYWDDQHGIGHRHTFFFLKDCVNPENPAGFYNEFLKEELMEHKRVFEALGGKMAIESVPEQLSGVGFSSTKRNSVVLKIKGATERIMKVEF